MAIIYSYPQAKPKASDLIIGTVTYDGTVTNPIEGNPTRTFSIQSIVDLAASYKLSTTQTGTNATLRLTNSTGDLSVVNLVKGNGIALASNGSNAITITNSLPDQTVVLTGSGSTTVTGTYPIFNINSTDTTYTAGTGINITNEIITNTAPDQIVSLVAGSNITVTGTYPNFTIAATGGGGGEITSIAPGTGIIVDATNPAVPIVTNAAPDRIVSITGSGVAVVSGVYPDFNIDVAAGEQGEIVKDSFISDGVETNYQLSITPTSANYTEVFISGVYQEASTYTLSADTIILSAPADNGDTIEVVIFNLGSAGGGGGGEVSSIIAGSGISVSSSTGNITVTNTEPDQIITLTGSGSTTITGTYPSFNIDSTNATYTAGSGIEIISDIINNTAPDQIVSLTAGSNVTITGTYPNFTIAANGGTGGGITSVVAGSDIAVDITDPENPIVSNTAPDQTVVLTGSGAATITGTYPGFNVDVPVINTSDFITNANDVYPVVSKVTNIVSLTQAEYDSLSLVDENALYVIVG